MHVVLPRKSAVVQVTIDVATLHPTPKFFDLYYTHGDGPGNPLLPHAVEWLVVGLRPGERVDIELREIPSHRERADHRSLLHSVFHEHDPFATPRWSWSIPHGAGPVTSGYAHLPTNALGEFEIGYDILYIPVRGVPKLLDPDIRIIPDP